MIREHLDITDSVGLLCITHGEEKRNAYRIFVGKPGGRRQLARLKRRWDNIKIDLRDT